ncbi:hypothetical protein QYE76_007488 [Lolium multiflorum]|uniref:Uncharacterized protein n=1 Tax=Lolium multiflorum TaxID=4521 RepID=A0AAD8RXT9_LOLMU|nr:hypothetical protein QYE76_007488 [Lolium multiflorum]
MRHVSVSADAARSLRASSFTYPVPHVRDSEIDRADLPFFPLLCCPSATAPPQPPPRRTAAVHAVCSGLAVLENRICVGFQPTQMDMWNMLEKFRAEVIDDSSSDEESDHTTQTMATAAASILLEHNVSQMPVHRGSVKGCSKNCRAIEWKGTSGSTRTTSTSPIREPTVEDTRRLLSINESRGFPGMIGSIDCMHWEWKNYPFGWQGQYSGHAEGCTVVLEAVISQDLWIWHSFFGKAGSNNDINVLHRSPVFNRLMQGKAPRVSYEINENEYDKPYYLVDGIYPNWATLVKTVCNPNTEKTKRFAKMQEACRKDVERGFDVLQARWAIVRHPARTWSLRTMHEVMTRCVIMHNMIVENGRPDGRNEHQWDFQGELVALVSGASSWQQYLHMNVEVTDEIRSKRLQTDLIEHQWALAGHEDNA